MLTRARAHNSRRTVVERPQLPLVVWSVACGILRIQVRLCFGDPAGRAVAVRGHEEGIGDTLAAKIRASLTYYRPLMCEESCGVRLHDTTLYPSLFRYDNQLLVNLRISGQPASANPVLHLRRADAVGWFDRYAGSLEAVWARARLWAPGQEGTPADGQD